MSEIQSSKVKSVSAAKFSDKNESDRDPDHVGGAGAALLANLAVARPLAVSGCPSYKLNIQIASIFDT